MAQDKRTLNYVEIDPITHETLVSLANMTGVSVSEMAGHLLDRYTGGFFKKQKQKSPLDAEDDRPGEIVAMDNLWKAKNMIRAQRMVRSLAALYKESPSEKLAEMLQESCDSLGMDYESVLQYAEDDPFSSIMMEQYGNNSKFSQCISWLTDFMQEVEAIPSKDLYRIGERKGYSEKMINRVKQHLSGRRGETGMDVVSERIDGQWHYVLKEITVEDLKYVEPEYQESQLIEDFDL